jgi:hypothetical protein
MPDIYLLYCLLSTYYLTLPAWYLSIVSYFLSDIYLLFATSCPISLYYLLLPAWYLSIVCYFLSDIYLLSALLPFWYLPIICLISAYCMPLSLYLPGNWQFHARIFAYFLPRKSFFSFLSSLICLFWHVAVFRRKTRHGDCNRGTAGFAYVGGACVVNKRLEKVIHCKKG